MKYSTIEFEVEGNVATVTIAREAVLNALSTEVLRELRNVVDEIELSDEIAAVIVTGKGKAFVAGADIAEMSAFDTNAAEAFAETGGALMTRIEQSSKVFIAAVNGYALGGGCELALACDMIIASGKAKFGQPEVKLAVIPGFGGTQRLIRRVGVGQTRRLVLTGQIIGADEALSIGLADEVVAPEELESRVTNIAQAVASNGPLAIAEAKRVIRMGESCPLEQALFIERKAFASLFATSDQIEGMTAQQEKRAPKFKGQ